MASCPSCGHHLEIGVEVGTGAHVLPNIPENVQICIPCGTILKVQRMEPASFRTLSESELAKLDPLMQVQIHKAQEIIRDKKTEST